MRLGIQIHFDLLKFFSFNFSASRCPVRPVRNKRNISRRSPSDDYYDSMPKGKFVKSIPSVKSYSINKEMLKSSQLSINDDETNNN